MRFGEESINNMRKNAILKKMRSKRSEKTKKIWGWILIALGAIALLGTMTISVELVIEIAMIAVGAGLLFSAKKNVKKWDSYEMCINPRGNTSIAYIADMLGVPESKARIEINNMIRRGFFMGPHCDIEAYIEPSSNLLVMSAGGRPLEPLSNTIAKEAVKKQKETTKQLPLDEVRLLISQIDDTDMLEALCSIEESVRKIEKDKVNFTKENVDKINSYYLPQVIALSKKFKAKDGSPETMNAIKEAIRETAETFENMEKKGQEAVDLETLVDIDVLRTKLQREGMSNSDFDVNKVN